jgi:hypothetical protein
MANYLLYGDSCDISQSDMVKAIQTKYPYFNKRQMSLACNPQRNALQLIPAAEEILVKAFGEGPGLSISAKVERNKWHQLKNKPNQLCVRLNNDMFERMQALRNQMGFASNQDFLEACVAEFLTHHEVRRAG